MGEKKKSTAPGEWRHKQSKRKGAGTAAAAREESKE